MDGVEVSVKACSSKVVFLVCVFGVFGLIEFVAQHTLPCRASCHCVHNEVHVED